MFNVAVIRLKDLIKYLVIFIVIIIFIIMSRKYFYKNNINIVKKISNKMSEYEKDFIDIEMPLIKRVNKDEDEYIINKSNENKEQVKRKLLNIIFGLQLSAINLQEYSDNNYNKEKNIEEEKNEDDKNNTKNEVKTENSIKDEKIELSKKEQKTEVITNNPIAEAYTKKIGNVKIKNETSFSLSNEELSSNKVEVDKSNIIIFHTHTCESYTSSEKYSYKPTGNFRTTDLNYSVAKVGDELTKYLKKYKLNVIHDKTYHDYPSYNGSYARSLVTVTEILKNKKADIIIDLHRDAIGSYSSYAPIVKIGDDVCSQLMFVIGSNGGKLEHPNWKKNLQFAIKMQENANKEYPGLFKPIILRNSRYNQHLGKAACIIEVGSTGNTLEQCLNSMKYLAKIINEF